MKKSSSIILSLAMVCTMSATAFAADSSTDLSAIADATIQVTQTTSESGAITNTFNKVGRLCECCAHCKSCHF